MSAHVTADWHEICPGEYYRKTELYTMGWLSGGGGGVGVDLDNFAFVGAPYGGPIAIVRDEKKFTRITPAVPVKPIISIYSPAGNQIHAIKWDSGVLVKMGWSSSEDLLCIQEDGNILVYSIFGQYKETLHCLSSSTESNINKSEKAYEAEIFHSNSGTGVAYLTTKENFIVMNNYKQLKIRKYPRVPGDGHFSSWAVCSNNGNKQTEIIAAKEGGLLYLVDMKACNQVKPEFDGVVIVNGELGPGPTIIYISVSLNGEHVALFTESGNLWLGSSDCSVKYCEIPTSIGIRPKQIAWCGTQAVAITWDSVPNLLLVNRAGQKLTFPMDSKCYLVSEIDSVRVVSNATHEIIQKVPKDTRLIFGIGSVAPGSWLLEASKEYLKKSYKADDYIRCIQNLEEAVRQCVDAAGYEFNPTNQKVLMKAAQFGKCFLPKYDPESYVGMCQRLRILNSVKDYKIGIPLTYTQLDQMSDSVLIDRLVLRRHYPLAIKIAEFLKLPDSIGKSRILAHWACYKVGQMHIEDSKLAAEIYSKLKSDSAVSYSEIADKAFELGRKKLAHDLAQYEIRKSSQVPLFLKLGDNKNALSKAVESGDSNLIYDVILKLRDSLPQQQFQMLIRSYPLAQNLYIKYCKIFKPDAVRSIYEMEDDYYALAELAIFESYSEKRFESRISSLHTAHQIYSTRNKNDLLAQLCEEQIKLLKHQISLEQQYGDPFLDLSLRDTIKKLLCRKEIKMADKMKSEYKVSERVYWLMRLSTLGSTHDWQELEKLSKVKKFPGGGGFEDFVEVCLDNGNKDEALKYLPKVKEDLQVKFYVEAGYYEEAAKIAFNQKDANNLEYIYGKCVTVDREVAAKVKELLDRVRPAGADGSLSSVG